MLKKTNKREVFDYDNVRRIQAEVWLEVYQVLGSQVYCGSNDREVFEMVGIIYWRERLAALEKRKLYLDENYYKKKKKEYEKKIAIYLMYCCN